MRGAGKLPAEPSAGYMVYDRRNARLGRGARARAELPDVPTDTGLPVVGVTLMCTSSPSLPLLLLAEG